MPGKYNNFCSKYFLKLLKFACHCLSCMPGRRLSVLNICFFVGGGNIVFSILISIFAVYYNKHY